MTIARILTEEEFNYIKLTLKIDKHEEFGMHLRAKTFNEILEDPSHIRFDLHKIKRSCGMTKGNFISSSATGRRYLQYSTKYFNTPIHIATHRLIYMLHNNVILLPDQLVNHIDGNTFNNHIDNLELVSALENVSLSKSIKLQEHYSDSGLPEPDALGQYKIVFKYKNISIYFGTSKDLDLVMHTLNTITELRKKYLGIESIIDTFVSITKYKTLEDRLDILGLNSINFNSEDLHSALIYFTEKANIHSAIKQAGVREDPSGKFRVSIRINGDTVNFGSYKTLIEANECSMKIRELKNNAPEYLHNLIISKPSGIKAADYYGEHLWNSLH